jgi:hypothetical protein
MPPVRITVCMSACYYHTHCCTQSAVLRDRRAEMEAAMHTEEEELARLSEEARSKVYTYPIHYLHVHTLV